MKNPLRLAYTRLIVPFQQSMAPVNEVSRGALVGMFVGLAPLMGVQMYIAAAIWIISRYVLRCRFNLPIAIALVWITNPLTVVPIYYGYLLTGNWLLSVFDLLFTPILYEEFQAMFMALQSDATIPWVERLVGGIVMLFWEFGWPIVVGSTVWAIPLALFSYPLTAFLLRRYRMMLAREEGLSYEDWTRQHIDGARNQHPASGLEPARQPET